MTKDAFKDDPLKNHYYGCTTEEVIKILERKHNVIATAEDFKKHRRQVCLTLHVAALGQDSITIHNPEYRVYWWEPPIDVVKKVWRMAKSEACRQAIVRAFKIGYQDIDKYEFTDEFRKQAAERHTKEKAK